MATDVTATTQQPATTSSVTEVNNSDSDSDDQDDESDQSEHLTVDDGNGEFDTDSDQNEDDFMTDQEAEVESDHDDCILRWKNRRPGKGIKRTTRFLKSLVNWSGKCRVTAQVVNRRILDPNKIRNFESDFKMISTFVFFWIHYLLMSFGNEWL